MSIIVDKTLRDVGIPFPNFQPNTLILSEQVNDNNDEIQYKTNLLIEALNSLIKQSIDLETYANSIKSDCDDFSTSTNVEISGIKSTINTNKEHAESRLTSEILKVNNVISNNDKQINTKVDNIKTETDKVIDSLDKSKGDSLEVKNTLLYLKSGDKNISVADLAGLGGGIGRSTNIAFGQSVNTSDWVYDDVTELYKVNINHKMITSTPLVTFFDEDTGFNMFDVSKVIDSNNVEVYNDVAVDVYISIINGSSKIELLQSILDDDYVTNLRTWSSEKIRREIDGKTVDLTPLEAKIEDNERSILALQNQIGGQIVRAKSILTNLSSKIE